MTKNFKRFLAILLAVSMILSSQAVTFAAEEIGAASSEAMAAEEGGGEEDEYVEEETYSDDDASIDEASSEASSSSEEYVEAGSGSDEYVEEADEYVEEDEYIEEAPELTEEPEYEPTETPAADAEPTDVPDEAVDAEPTETPDAEPTETPDAEPTETPDAAAENEVRELRVYEAVDNEDAPTIKVVATLDNATSVPDDAKLFVRPVKDEEGNGTGEFYEYQPDNNDGVKVEFEFLNNQLVDDLGAEKAEDVEILHLPLVQEVSDAEDTINTTADAGALTAEDIVVENVATQAIDPENGEAAIKTENFSVFAFTVDFHKDGKDYSIPGMTQILLSTLIEKLEIKKENGELVDVKEVEEVKFSNPDLVTVEKVSGIISYTDEEGLKEGVDVGEKDFLISSKGPFSSDEELTLVLSSGEAVTVKVTDDQEEAFLVEVKLLQEGGEDPSSSAPDDYYVLATLTRDNEKYYNYYQNGQALSFSDGIATKTISRFYRDIRDQNNPVYFQNGDTVEIVITKGLDNYNGGQFDNNRVVIRDGSVADGFTFRVSSSTDKVTFTGIELPKYKIVVDKDGEDVPELPNEYNVVFQGTPKNNNDNKYYYQGYLNSNSGEGLIYSSDAYAINSYVDGNNIPSSQKYSPEDNVNVFLYSEILNSFWSFDSNKMIQDGSVIELSGNPYKISIDNNSATSTTTITVRKAEKYTVDIDVKNQDDTVESSFMSNDNYYLFAYVNNDEKPYYISEEPVIVSRTQLAPDPETGRIAHHVIPYFIKDNGVDKIFFTGTENIKSYLVRSTSNTKPSKSDCLSGTATVIPMNSGDVVGATNESGDDGYEIHETHTDHIKTITLKKLPKYTIETTFSPSAPGEDEFTGTYYILTVLTSDEGEAYSLKPVDKGGVSTGQIDYFTDADGKKHYLKDGDSVKVYVLKSKDGNELEITDVNNSDKCVRYSDGQITENYEITYDTSQERKTKVTFTKTTTTGSAHTANLVFYEARQSHVTEEDERTKKIPTDLTGNYYLVAYLTANGKTDIADMSAWNVKKLDLNTLKSAHTTAVTFAEDTVYNLCDSDKNATGETTVYDPSVYDIHFRVYHHATNGEITTYPALTASDSGAQDWVDNYDFFYNDQPDMNTEQTYIRMESASEKEYKVRVYTDTGVFDKSSDHYYLLVEAEHKTTPHTYYFTEITADITTGGIDYVIPDSAWKDDSGNDANDRFTGNENVKAVILKGNSGLTLTNAIARTGCSEIKNGERVGAYTVQYKKRTKDAESNPEKVLYCSPIEFKRVYSDDLTQRAILGEAYGYGIWANLFHQTGEHDVETNFAAGQYQLDSKNTVHPDLTNAAGNFIVGEITKEPLYMLLDEGASTKVYLPDDEKSKFVYEGGTHVDQVIFQNPAPTKEQLQTKVSNLVDNVATIGDSLLQKESITIPSDTDIVDVTSFGDNDTIYVNADQHILDLFNGNCLLKVKKKENQTVIFNVSSSEPFTLGKIAIDYNNSGTFRTDVDLGLSKSETGKPVLDNVATHIIWNVPNALEATSTANSATGTFLLPRAHLTVTGTSSTGWIVADKVTTRAEWHSAAQNWSAPDEFSKVLTGRSLANEEFTFVKTGVSYTNTNNEKSDLSYSTTAKNNEKGLVSFEKITYTAAGTYVYKVEEQKPTGVTSANPTLNGITYDCGYYLETVHIENRNGNLVVTATDYARYDVAADGKENRKDTFENVFHNTYEATGGEKIEGTKILKDASGKNLSLGSKTFTFSVTADSNNPTTGVDTSKLRTSASNDSTGKIDFGRISFSEEGIWKYTIRETSQDENGITVDNTVYTVTFTVTDEDHNGVLSVNKTITKPGDGESVDTVEAISFTNIYEEQKGSLEVTKQIKKVVGSSEEDYALKTAQTFYVGISEEAKDAGAVLTNVKAISIAEDGSSGKVTFDELDPGNYYVYEAEKVTENDTVTYKVVGDTFGAYTVTDGERVTVAAGETKTASVTNKYEALGNATIEVGKKLTGKTLEKDAFSFKLSAYPYVVYESGEEKITVTGPLKKENGDAYSESELTKTNAGPDTNGVGKVSFDTLYYTLEDAEKVYYYKVIEDTIDTTENPGVSRDTVNGPEEIYVRVTVGADQGNGTLGEATVDYFSDENFSEQLISTNFVNKYDASGTAKLSGAKSIQERRQRDDQDRGEDDRRADAEGCGRNSKRHRRY